jgi:hypothetical protein
MTGHQGCLIGTFEQRDALAEKVRGHVQLFGRGSEAAYPGYFQKYPDQIPVRHSSRDVRAGGRTPALR